MKKIFTLVMLSILTVMTANAAVETVLWEGDLWISWEGGNTDDAHKQVSISDVANFADDQVMYIYLAKDTEADHLFTKDYHQYRFDGNWDVHLIDAVDVNDDYVKVKFTVTSAIKSSLVEKTFNIHGHGIRVLRVTKEVADCPNDILWTGTQTITGWSGDDGKCVKLNLNTLGITSACNLCVLVSDYTGGNMRFVNNKEWAEYPSTDYDHLVNKDENDIVTIPLTQAFVDAVIGSENKEVIIFGNNFTVNAVATSKDAILQLTKGLLVNMDANGYATFSSNWKLNLAALPDGVEAYTATLTGKTLSFTKKDDGAVNAGTGLLLKGAAWNPYKIPVTTGESSAVADNALRATLTEQSLKSDEDNYLFVMTMANITSELTFKKLPATATTIPANKAYVSVPASAFSPSLAPQLSISFGNGSVTGISDALRLNNNEDQNKSYFNLAGQRVAQPTKGLYIVNGRKVVIK